MSGTERMYSTPLALMAAMIIPPLSAVEASAAAAIACLPILERGA
jgi:hypothetical protein